MAETNFPSVSGTFSLGFGGKCGSIHALMLPRGEISPIQRGFVNHLPLCSLLVFQEFCFSLVFTSLLSFLLPFPSPASPQNNFVV